MGNMLPTLYELCIRLEKIQPMPHYCCPFVTAIINGIHVRFENMLNDKELIASAILTPHFKRKWTSKRDAVEKGAHFNSNAPIVFLYPFFLEGCGGSSRLNCHISGFTNTDCTLLGRSPKLFQPRSGYIRVILSVVVQPVSSHSLWFIKQVDQTNNIDNYF